MTMNSVLITTVMLLLSPKMLLAKGLITLSSKDVFSEKSVTPLTPVKTSTPQRKLLNFQQDKAVSGGAGIDGGGGDICEDRIKAIRNDISSWIQKGGSKGLKLTGVSEENYSQSMLMQITVTKIRCVSEGDDGYPVLVNSIPKICRFDRSAASSQITCDLKKFLSLNDNQQYILTHHEYAGLAHIENPYGADSVYHVSDQITHYLVNQIVKKLVVMPAGNAQYCNIINGTNTSSHIIFSIIRGSDANKINDGQGAYFSKWVETPKEAMKALADLEKNEFCKSVVYPQYCNIVNGAYANGHIIFNIIRGSDANEINDGQGAYFSKWVETTKEAQEELQDLQSLGLCL